MKTYLGVGGVLFAGTVITVILGYLSTGNHALDIGIGLLIASIKVAFVALIFMHLNNERGLIYKTLLFTFLFFCAMMYLFVLALKDPIHFSFFK
jgi:cytochrome c oxidase subunit IV